MSSSDNNNNNNDKNDQWSSWDEELDENDTLTKCLFSDKVCSDSATAIEHDKNSYGFDILKVKNDLNLGFYESIKLINYIRKMVSEKKSIIDQKQFETHDELIGYMKNNNQFQMITRDLDFWNDDTYLQPTIQNDPLLFTFQNLDDDWSSDEDDDIYNIDDIRNKIKSQK
eukprot:TRINITY_DN5238_c0_g1_i1.p1 TRINITY_DN5238_c0_g1~~TRINITY_DN5238_c0_g1_i1.p1  ORF type:complete len:170 (+),score=46.19 TRINITY_DN5238_c0_g1_i1:105-614(+)